VGGGAVVFSRFDVARKIKRRPTEKLRARYAGKRQQKTRKGRKGVSNVVVRKIRGKKRTVNVKQVVGISLH
jgi:hypothetical protein